MTGGSRRPSRLAVRLTATLLAVAAIGMAVMGLYVSRTLEANAVRNLEEGLLSRARLVRERFLPALEAVGPVEHVQALAEQSAAVLNARVTVIASDGVVLADSGREIAGVREMENHAGRPEVLAALSGQTGNDVRRSRTLGVEMLYVAIPLRSASGAQGVLRVALPLTAVAEAVRSIRQTVAAGATLALGVALGVGFFVSRRVTQPVRRMQRIARRMAQGQFEDRLPVHGSDEIAELGHALNLMAAALREKIESVEGEQRKVAAILEGMVEGVVALDERTRVILMNPGARAILGLGPDPVAGRPLLEVVRHRELYDLVGACLRAREGDRAHREVELGPPLSRTVEANAVPLAFAPHGRGVLLVLHDVTELRRLARVRAEFVANVSHELRTPLSAITGYLETLLGGALDEPAHARRFLEVANSHAERLRRLVDDLLELSNIESGKVVLAPTAVVVRDVADGVARMLEQPLIRKALAFRNEVPPGLRVHADRDRLVQILVNLVDNAIKFTPQAGQITVQATPTPGGPVEIAVADTGIGIPSTDLSRIAERFYRVDKARSRELGGTGLGLAIVKHLVQAHAGKLRIESELNKGTTVRFTLPAA